MEEEFDIDKISAQVLDLVKAMPTGKIFTFAELFAQCGVQYDVQRYFALFSLTFKSAQAFVRQRFEGAFEGLPFAVEYVRK